MFEVVHGKEYGVDFTKGVCAICKKKKVSKWCDFTIAYKQNTVFLRDFEAFKAANEYGAQNEQCDLPMCEDCAAQQQGDMHLCPHHHELMKQAALPTDYLQMRQLREKQMIEREFAHGDGEVMQNSLMKDFMKHEQITQVMKENSRLQQQVQELKRSDKLLKEELADYRSGQMKLFGLDPDE